MLFDGVIAQLLKPIDAGNVGTCRRLTNKLLYDLLDFRAGTSKQVQRFRLPEESHTTEALNALMELVLIMPGKARHHSAIPNEGWCWSL